MSNVNSFSIHEIMRNLRKRRSIFHSEADFQHALAWQIHTDFSDCEIRLEYKPISRVNMFVDIWAWIEDIQIAIEVKYPAAKHIIKRQDLFETFHLDKGGPLDTARYGFLKDIQRLEKFSGRKDTLCFAVLLTNQRRLWEVPQRGWKQENDYQFRIHQKQWVNGHKTWAPKTSQKTKQSHPPLDIKGRYVMEWQNYSSFRNVTRNSQFRYLAVPVYGNRRRRD